MGAQKDTFGISTRRKCFLSGSVYTRFVTRWPWWNIIRLSEKDLSSRWHCGTYVGSIEAGSPALPGSELQEPQRETEFRRARFGCSNYKMSPAFHLILHSQIVRLIYLTHRYVRVHGGGVVVVGEEGFISRAFSSFTDTHFIWVAI